MIPGAERWLQAERQRRAVLRVCHAAQLAFVRDESPRVAACCSRRAGKSVGVLARHLMLAERYPGEMALYVGRSVAAARDVLEPALRALKRSGIDPGIRPWSKGRTYWVWPNGHRLWLAGCADRSAIDEFRGLPLTGASVDEAQGYPWLDELLSDAIEPALLDHRGWLTLIGTPAPVPVGVFCDASQGLYGWSAHHWTARDNPHLGDVDSWLAAVRQRHGWTEQTPRYQREYLGRWVRDGDALVYPLDRARNGWSGELPPGDRRRVLGVDLGSTGTTALVVVCAVRDTPGYWVEHAEGATGLSVSQVCQRITDLRSRLSIPRIVVDAGGLGGAYVSELQSRWQIPAEPARKQDKLAYIEHLRSDILAGVLHVQHSAQPIWDEAAALQWADDRRGYDDRLPDHYLDALLYAWRALRPEVAPEVGVTPEPGSPEYWAQQQRQLRVERDRLVKVRRERR